MVKLWRIDPEFFLPFYHLPICWSLCTDQPHSDSSSVSVHGPAPHDVTCLVMDYIISILSRIIVTPFFPTTHISSNRWFTLLSFLANVFLFWFISFSHVVFFCSKCLSTWSVRTWSVRRELQYIYLSLPPVVAPYLYQSRLQGSSVLCIRGY